MPCFETSDHTTLFYTDWGMGDPVVFVHGQGLGADMWEYQTLDLTDQGVRCVAYDQRGYGRSDQPGHGYDFDTFADDLAALLGHLDLRGVTLVGYSLGCGVIARYLSRHGTRRVARAVLVATNTPCLLKAEGNPEGMEREVVYDPFVAGLRRDRPALLTAMAPAFFGAGGPDGAVSPECVQWAIGLFQRASPHAILAMARVNADTDLRADMAAFTVPTLIVHGAADPFAAVEATALRTARAIPGSQLTVYEGASHGLFVTHRDRLNADVLAFIRGERAARAARERN